MEPITVIVNGGRCSGEAITRLQSLGFSPVIMDSVDDIRMVPTKEDHRFQVAIMALQGVLSNPLTGTGRSADFEIVAQSAVGFADALLAELAK